jgi:hypothetical protein
MTTLRDVVKELDVLDEDATIYADGSSPAARAAVVGDEAERAAARNAGLRTFLEVALAREAIAVWSEWRGGAEPTLDDRLEAVAHYATNDAYLPVD